MSQFDGNGFDKTPLSETEAAQIRHMRHEIDGVWPQLKALAGLLKSAKTLAGVLGVTGVLGGAVAFAVQQGWFG